MPTTNIVKAVVAATVLFLVGAVIESVITAWMCKKLNVCPYAAKIKKPK